MSDLAASGGYYIAMPGQVIVAQPATLTGSIGIFTGKFALGGTMDKIGVTTGDGEVGRERRHLFAVRAVHAGAAREGAGLHAGLLRQLRREGGRVAQDDAGTRSTRWRRAASGPGEQARERGLVDALGGLDAAVAHREGARQIPADEDVELVVYPPRRSFYEVLARAVRRRAASKRRGVCSRARSRADAVAALHRAGTAVPARRAAGVDAVHVRAVAVSR